MTRILTTAMTVSPLLSLGDVVTGRDVVGRELRSAAPAVRPGRPEYSARRITQQLGNGLREFNRRLSGFGSRD